ncbi:hypothetical protein [Leifsonia sp. Leaf264]|uniref:hypothetical protein n=1 Tax=Leifsonia sp. Leaf264 TaxID=1736314 RepID=UPI0006F76318|nr:hypothetical protein [Leifsonia sp. Leaf264]KQO98740.1 hypothetical protein ASF30_11810 [Leifsonia sp. Leaf264]
MKRNTRRLIAVRDELIRVDPSLELDLLDSCGDPNTPCLHLVFDRGTECFFIWGSDWLVKDLSMPNGTAAHIGVRAGAKPSIVALSILSATLVNELNTSMWNPNADRNGEPDPDVIRLAVARVNIMTSIADGSARTDTATAKHARLLVSDVSDFVNTLALAG